MGVIARKMQGRTGSRGIDEQRLGGVDARCSGSCPQTEIVSLLMDAELSMLAYR